MLWKLVALIRWGLNYENKKTSRFGGKTYIMKSRLMIFCLLVSCKLFSQPQIDGESLFWKFYCEDLTDKTSKTITNFSDREKDSIIMANLTFLDSIVRSNKTDTVYPGYFGQVLFIEGISGIEASGNGGYLGRDSFSRSDVSMWRTWYLNRQKRKWSSKD